MRYTILSLMLLAGIYGSQAALADEFSGSSSADGLMAAALDQQASNAQTADPTAANSLRSHGRP